MVLPSATSAKVTVVFSAVVALPSRVTNTKPVCVASAVRASLFEVPPTLRLVTSWLAVALVKTTVFGPANTDVKFANVPAVFAAILAAPEAMPANAAATVAALAPPTGAVYVMPPKTMVWPAAMSAKVTVVVSVVLPVPGLVTMRCSSAASMVTTSEVVDMAATLAALNAMKLVPPPEMSSVSMLRMSGRLLTSTMSNTKLEAVDAKVRVSSPPAPSTIASVGL